MQLSDAAEEDAEVDSDEELWAESKVWALASGIVAAARPLEIQKADAIYQRLIEQLEAQLTRDAAAIDEAVALLNSSLVSRENIERAEQALRRAARPESAGEPLSTADAPLFRLARKAWSSAGLTPEDIEAEGHRFKPGAGGFATVAVMVDSVARTVPAQADFVPELARRFRALFEPIPKP